GRAVRRHLHARGLEVFAVARRPLADSQGHSVVLEHPESADAVRQAVQAIAPDIVMHLAGSSSASSYAQLYQANVVFAANLMDAASSMDRAPRVLLVGSAAEYGAVPESQLPVTEDFHCRPNTVYGISKLAQTHHAAVAAARGLPVTVARLFNPIGEGMPESLALGSFAAQIARMGAEGGILRTGDLDVVRDFIDVDVAAEALVEIALRHHGGGEIVNVCTGQGRTLLELTQRLIAVSRLPVAHAHDSSRIGNSSVRSFIGDPSRLRSLGFDPTPFDVDLLLGRILEAARRRDQAE
ncbi:MAG: NAD-dependent epimerase/dehydratase family protein, partial [Gammaproteobacteria bacterium]|nr:NAD-dependent epimerase/dehydratase family protein [Gammaproteobacteria bacterium]